MTSENFKLVLRLYDKFVKTIQEQRDLYADIRSGVACQTTLDLFETTKRYPLDEMRSAMFHLEQNNNDCRSCLRLIRQSTQLYDSLKGEKDAIRIEKRESKAVAEYEKLILKSIKAAKLLIDTVNRSV